MENEPIFSNEIPMPPGKLLRSSKSLKAEKTTKRKYTRKALEIPPPENGPETLGEKTRLSSSGLEYLKALTALLALIGEPQRTRLVDFIIQEKII